MKNILQTLLTLGALTTGTLYADGNLEIQINQSAENNNPLSVTFNLTNNSDELVKIFKSSIPFDGEVGKNIFDVRNNNHELRYVGRVVERMHEVNEENFLYLDAGESYETTVNLSTLYNFSRQNREYDVSFNSSVYVAYDNGENEHLALHSNNLDIEASVNRRTIRKREQTYETSCTENQQNLLGQALSYAENLAVNSANLLHTTDANNTQFREWFGAGDYDTVTTHFDNISSTLSKNVVNFDCGCHEGYVAYVYPYQPHTIYLCNGFWSTQMQGTDSKAGTIIHETSHFRVVAGTSDHAYGQGEARGLAQNTPAHAISNADNHEYFAETNLEAMIVAPTALSVADVTSTTAQLRWEENAENERGFEIFNGVERVGEVGADETSFDITGLTAGESYTYLVRAVGENSTISTTANVSFVTTGTSVGLPLAPTALQVSSIQRNEVVLTWEDNSDNEQGFKLYQGEILIATLGANVNRYELANLVEATEYTYSVKAYNTQGESSATSISFETAQPLNLTSTSINLGDRVAGRWNQNSVSTHRTGRYAEFYTFTLEADTNVIINLESTLVDTYLYLLSGGERDAQIITRDDDGGRSTNSRISQRLVAGTYTLETTTYSASKSGTFVLDIKEDNSGLAPAKPTTVNVKNIKATSAFLFWTPVQNEDGFKLYLDGVEISTTDMGVNGYSLSNLRPETAYTFSVKSFNRYGISEEVSVTFSTPAVQVETTVISMDSYKNGQWVSTSRSTHRSGRYAQYYTFTLTEATTVVIDLGSSTDAFLYLLAGNGKNGTKLAFDDDGGAGRNSKIIKSLEAGTYTIEATTFASAKTGSFTVKLGHMDTASANSISLNQRTSGQWSSETRSTHRNGGRAYAQFYTFTLSEAKNIVIDLESSTDAYLYLLNGNGVAGSIIRRNDDGGRGTNSRISRRLNAGTYTIEATTFGSYQSGSFNLQVRD